MIWCLFFIERCRFVDWEERGWDHAWDDYGYGMSWSDDFLWHDLKELRERSRQSGNRRRIEFSFVVIL